ncbi:PD-(D/E)XK nuclease family protein [Silvibacterium sp.]|uniref:PD-(D/E)XK nuclease family protein n=1 Tax=Silvibacterium sp. TaxID=1964179 RepID=UPI0039E65623
MELEQALEAGALIVTANPRAARWLRYEYALRMREAGRQAWKTPPIQDWNSWIGILTGQLAPESAPLILSSLQEEQLWLRVQQQDDDLAVVSPASMATLAAEAYALLSTYEAHAARNHSWDQIDAGHFRQWAAAFDRECAQRGWLSASQLESSLGETIATSTASLPEEILLVGFDRVTPAQNSLLESLGRRGVNIAHAATPTHAAPPQTLRTADLREEINLCAEWLHQQLASSRPDAPLRIAVVTPSLESVRAEIDRIFRQVLAPETSDITAPAHPLPYEFSLGQPLASVPVIRAALLILRWLVEPLAEEELTWLLLSGFMTASDAETLAAARLDAELRARASLSMEIGLSSFLNRIPERMTSAHPLAQRVAQLRTVAEVNGVHHGSHPPSRWAELIPVLLRQTGFPGGRTADTVRYQAPARWDRILDDLALLDYDGRELSFSTFLHILERHAGSTLFALESHDAPIQIMGALEASGQAFDALWFLGLDDGAWPLSGTTHPLLPRAVQIAAGMPHATPALDLELSRAVTHSLAASAPAVVFSCAQRNRDGDLRPSPLFAAVAPESHLLTTAEWRAAYSISPTVPAPALLEEISDATGTLPWPVERSAGGADVLRDQAACPFRAFATRRLYARELNRSEWGLTAAERGNLLHDVLEAIWSPDHGRLHTLDDLLAVQRESRLSALVEETIADVFLKHASTGPFYSPDEEGNIPDEWTRAYLDSEQRRLARQLTDWLQYEATRAPFEVIATEEKLVDVQVGELRLNLRGDRVDQLPGYRNLLIDYKTGLVSVADWRPPRPADPQLPLYAAFGNIEDICGVVFARIRAGESCFLGQVEDAKTQLLPDLTATSALVKYPYTEAIREEWTAALLELAAGFLRGDALVDPKNGASTCQHCPLPTLCRVAETRSLAFSEDAETADIEPGITG